MMTKEEADKYQNVLFRTYKVNGTWSTSVWVKLDDKLPDRIGSAYGSATAEDSMIRALVDAFGVPPCIKGVQVTVQGRT